MFVNLEGGALVMLVKIKKKTSAVIFFKQALILNIYYCPTDDI